MAYLTPFDYLKIIQDANLQQIITSNSLIQGSAELAAQAEAISYLRQKFDVSTEFSNTTQWVKTSPYYANDRVYLNAAPFVSNFTYHLGNLVLENGYVYECNIATYSGVFDTNVFTLLGQQYDIFYALTPFPTFNLGTLYNKGDKVYWLGKVYTCLIQTPVLSHEDGIQYYQTYDIPYQNIFPNDQVQGFLYCAYQYDYVVAAGTDITNESAWSNSDNRDQQMVMYFADITLYHLHARIAPRNIPQLRIDRYNAAIDWLKMAMRGDVTPNIPKLQPAQGGRIRFGSQIRNINSY